MLKYLLLLLIAVIVWRIWQKRPAKPVKAPRTEAPPERMVACARCGVLIPESDSLAEGGSYYCCEAHRRPSEPGSK